METIEHILIGRLRLAKVRLLKKRKITETGCWEWQGTCEKKGYGYIRIDGKHEKVHRLSMEIWKPEKYKPYLHVLHKNECQNKKCFNPDHLYCGSERANAIDRVNAGMDHNANKKKCPQGHEYTEENTYRSPRSSTGRQCKICMKEAKKRYRLFNFNVK